MCESTGENKDTPLLTTDIVYSYSHYSVLHTMNLRGRAVKAWDTLTMFEAGGREFNPRPGRYMVG